MKIISVNTGALTTVIHQGREIQTGIYKRPSSSPVEVLEEHLAQDHIADLTVHGGPHKAVYVYPVEHYDAWSQQYPELDFDSGMFGENLTVEGLLESEVFVGDRLHIGAVILEVSEPRQPCFKLGIKFNDTQIIKSFTRSGWSGFYLRIIEKGMLNSGDVITLTPGPREVSISDLNNFLRGHTFTESWFNLALASVHLSDRWKHRIIKKMPRPTS